jgi:hypothetical protein
MAAELVYVAEQSTACMSPDALRIMLNQNGLRCSLRREADQALLVLEEDESVLRLEVINDGITRIAMEVTFVDEDAPADRVCELLEMMGWVEQ